MTAIPSAAAFHRHLDKCRQCRENPFALCLLGHALLTGEDNEANPKTAIEFVAPVMTREKDPHPPHRQCGCEYCLPSFDDDAVPPPMARAPEIVDGVE